MSFLTGFIIGGIVGMAITALIVSDER